MSQENPKYDPTRTYLLSGAAHPGPHNRFVGVLRPAKGFVASGPILILPENAELVIGRQEGLGVTLVDDWVSRRHARVRRFGDEFVLDDLAISNGTYVDGVHVVACV